jgi:hypothetical protein
VRVGRLVSGVGAVLRGQAPLGSRHIMGGGHSEGCEGAGAVCICMGKLPLEHQVSRVWAWQAVWGGAKC